MPSGPRKGRATRDLAAAAPAGDPGRAAGESVAPGAAAGPRHHRVTGAGLRARRPRVVRHVVAGAVVAVYLLAAAVVVLAYRLAPMPEWLALHLLVLGAATNTATAPSSRLATPYMPTGKTMLHSPGS